MPLKAFGKGKRIWPDANPWTVLSVYKSNNRSGANKAAREINRSKMYKGTKARVRKHRNGWAVEIKYSKR